jgi:hypothetical protein
VQQPQRLLDRKGYPSRHAESRWKYCQAIRLDHFCIPRNERDAYEAGEKAGQEKGELGERFEEASSLWTATDDDA